MITVIPVTRLGVIAYLCVLGSCSKTCSNGTVQGIIGQGVSLRCVSKSCGSKRWTNDSQRETSPFIEPSKHTSLNSDGDTFELQIFNMSAYDVGQYSCWCSENNKYTSFICSNSLELICQAKVVVNNVSTLHNGSPTDSFPIVTINVNVMDTLEVKCPDSAVPDTDCHNVLQGRESAQLMYSFTVSSNHNNCTITCQAKKQGNIICSIKFTIKVSWNKTSNHYSTVSSTALPASNPVNGTPLTTLEPAYIITKVHDILSAIDKPASFPVIIVVCILVLIVLIVTLVASFCIFSLRSKSTSQSNQNVNVVNPPTEANIPIHPTYETVNEPSHCFLKRDDHSMESGAVGTDGFYFEVGGARKDDSLTHQPNSEIAETAITNDYYSEVNTSEVKLKTLEDGQETDTTLHYEVNQRKNQPKQKECTSSPQSCGDNKSVSNVPIYHVLEETKKSDKDTEGSVSNSKVMKAVVDKDK